MDLNALSRQFESIGATLDVRTLDGASAPAYRDGFTLDVKPAAKSKRGESYLLTLRPDTEKRFDLIVADIAPRWRHLLLLAKSVESGSIERRRFLCGHDERHWFVAALPDPRAASIVDAMETLKPAGARQMQRRNGVRAKDWNSRSNAGFIRQGEWFFLPDPEFAPSDPILILRDEPIRRGGGKPHRVEELYREGGQTVRVCARYPNGLLESQYLRLLERKPEAKHWPWQFMQRNPRVYARGKVRHSDHATITLPFWHQVLMSGEKLSPNVAFLD